MISITEKEFTQFQRFIFDAAGITLAASKKPLVCGRLEKRLTANRLGSYSEYIGLLSSGKAPTETQIAIDLLTTNETYFFRESKHFDLLRKLATEARGSGRSFRVWSAASSSGEEAYSIAMVLADCLADAPWEIVGSDISTRVLHKARQGHYPLSRTTHIPPHYLKRFCLKGIGPQEGTLLIHPELRKKVSFQQVNLNGSLPNMGSFDVIFLRNVMIYFSNETKQQIVERLVPTLRSGGYLCIGHSESLNGICNKLKPIAPSIYQKP